MAKVNHTRLVQPRAARRGVLFGALMALAAPKVVAAAPADTVESVKAAADALTASLARLHGGDWRVSVDHQNHFVLIMEKLSKGAAT